jgi:hypothetical protein
MFIQEWIEDHAKSAGFWRRTILSVTASFSMATTERCRRRRRLLLKWTCLLFALLIVEALFIWL